MGFRRGFGGFQWGRFGGGWGPHHTGVPAHFTSFLVRVGHTNSRQDPAGSGAVPREPAGSCWGSTTAGTCRNPPEPAGPKPLFVLARPPFSLGAKVGAGRDIVEQARCMAPKVDFSLKPLKNHFMQCPCRAPLKAASVKRPGLREPAASSTAARSFLASFFSPPARCRRQLFASASSLSPPALCRRQHFV